MNLSRETHRRLGASALHFRRAREDLRYRQPSALPPSSPPEKKKTQADAAAARKEAEAAAAAAAKEVEANAKGVREAKEKAVAEAGAKLTELEAKLEEMRSAAAAVTAELEGKVAAKLAAKAAKKEGVAEAAAAAASEAAANRAKAEAVVSSDGKVDLKKLASALSSSAGRIQAAAQEHKDSHEAHRDAHDVVVDLHQEVHAEVKKSENLIEHLQTRVIAADSDELQANKGNAIVGQKEDAPLKKMYRPLGEGYEMAEPGVACACLEMATPIHEFLGALSLTRYEFELAKEGYNTVGAFRQHEGAFTESDLESLGVELEPHRMALLGQIERTRLVSLHVTITSASGLPRGFPKPDKHSVRGVWGNSTRETTKQANSEGPNPEWKLGTLIFPAMDVALIGEEDLALQVIGNNKDKVKCELKIRRAEIGFDKLGPQSFSFQACSGTINVQPWYNWVL